MAYYPLISILIPVYNTEKYLDECLGSAAAQTYSNIQIVAVDDGSTDGSAVILARHAQRDCRIKVISKPNEGVMLARKRTIEEADGQYLYFLDSDDSIPPDAVGKLWAKLAGTGCDIAVSTIIRVKKSYSSVLSQEIPEVTRGEDFIPAMLNRSILPGMIGKLYDRRLFSGLEFFPGISIGEDYLLNIQIGMKPDFRGICFVKDALYYYNQHDASLIHRGAADIGYQERFAGIFYSLFDARPDISEKLAQELVRERVMRTLAYIKRSRNPWAGDRPIFLRTYEDVRNNASEIRLSTPRGTVTMIKMYRFRALKPLVLAVSTFQRWSMSIARRTKRRHSGKG